MSDFKPFSKLVHQRYTQMASGELFVIAGNPDDLYAKYLSSFSEGSNPVFKERTEHDCSCCKNFIRNLGNVVAIVDGKPQSIWDVKGAESPYKEVAAALNDFVVSQPIEGLFRSSERSYGAENTKQLLPGGAVHTWNHFHGAVATRHYTKDAGKVRGDYASSVHVFQRGLEELAPDALQTVQELINQKVLYRGEEHLPAIRTFQLSQKAYKKLKTSQERDAFVWEHASSPASRFRNTAIGTLIQDLSEGVDLEAAVRSFEAKVAPTNYKRPTALITQSMVKDAMKTINELGLETALERRFAKLSDVSVNNVLWVDNSVQGLMHGGVESLLMTAAVGKAPKEARAEDISIDDFMTKVLPTVSGIELLVKGAHTNNFVSLTAPVHADSGKLFKWGNDFGWSYAGNITDSIKEKVKQAGGNVTNAKLRVSLAWFNHDDLDIFVIEPNGNTICYHNKDGKLDVDMNLGWGKTRTPVENVSWKVVRDGVYGVAVNQFSQRETSDVGCVIEVESNGSLTQLSYAPALRGMVHMAKLTVQNGVVVNIQPAKGVTGGGISKEKWGVKTETFVKVNTLMHSPNHWDTNVVGNKHHIFILDGCKNDEQTRGIYNEFLNSGLEKHRKVFEILGDKTKCPAAEEQLSGLGFSSTRGDTVTVRVKGDKLQKTLNIKF